MAKRRIELTEAERQMLLEVAYFYRDDADPDREGDLRGVSARQWATLRRAIARIEGVTHQR